MRASLPGAVGRLGRNRPVLVAAALIALVGVATFGFGQVSRLQITQTVDAHWRGAYDILVTPNDRLVASAVRTSGFVEPDYLAFQGGGGISLRQWRRVQAIPGVDVAAPIGFVGYLKSDPQRPTVGLAPQCLPKHPSVYRVSVTVTSTDGHTPVVLSYGSIDALLGPADLSRDSVPFVTTNRSQDTGFGPDGVAFTLPSTVPGEINGVAAVDPGSERALLREPRSFLRELQIPARQLKVASFPRTRVPPTFTDSLLALGLFQLPDTGRLGLDARTVPVLPLEVGEHLQYPLAARMTVERLGPNLRDYPHSITGRSSLAAYARRHAGQVTPVGVSRVDLAADTRAYEPQAITLPWPHCTLTATGGAGDTARTVFSYAGRATYHAGGMVSGRPAFTVAPLGLTRADGTPGAGASFESYRSLVPGGRLSPAVRERFGGNVFTGTKFVPAPVGVFDNAALQLPADPLVHVPLGLYEPGRGTLLTNSGASTGRTLGPTPSPVGLFTAPPNVLTSIQAESRIRGHKIIDAIRVRVAGIGDFTAAAQDKVETVAEQIRALGLDVHIVAGSSPQPVVVRAPDYPSGPAATGSTTTLVGELWTTLGVAQSDVTTLTAGERQLVALALLLAVLIAICTVAVDTDGKRAHLPIWRSLGWTRRRQVWWLIGDTTVAMGLAAAAAVVVAVLTGALRVVLIAGIGAAVVVVTQTALAFALTRRAEAAGRDQPARAARRTAKGASRHRTPATRYALTALRRDLALFAGLAAAVAVSAITITEAVGGLRSHANQAGRSLLAGALRDQIRWTHLAAIALLILGSATVVVLLSRLQFRRRIQEFQTLSTLGWSIGRITAEVRTETLLGLALAAAATAILDALIRPAGAGPLIAVIVFAALAAAVLAVSTLVARRAVTRAVQQ